MQIEKFVTALVQSIDNNDLVSVLTDAQKQAIVAEFFAKADKDAILSVMPETLQKEFVADVADVADVEEEESEEEENVDLSTVPVDVIFDYVAERHMESFLDYADVHSVVEYVVENYPIKALCAIETSTVVSYVGDDLKDEILDYLGVSDHIDSLRNLLDILE